MEKKKILFISQEISPFLPKSEISLTARNLSQGIQEAGKEIRAFMPRFGVINERRHQLHEVIRLSGMNLIIDDTDHPLIIKVASISAARMQVYFIDNEEYFRRKNVLVDEKDIEFKDNDERSMFFCRGVLETVKKLGWQPDVIHCNGWMTALMPLYIKKIYNDDPHFQNTKVVYNIYNKGFKNNWDKRINKKLKFDGFDDNVAKDFDKPSFVNLTKAAVKHSDGITVSSEELTPELKEIFDAAECQKLDFVAEENQIKEFSDFFDKIIDTEVLV
ncbi:MAG: glycogen synthase [Crocinitomicaceae bacterium]|nr:glycogen synthase [Crocinitomicaceae bacterium]|tara:strand:- start:40851 stop:41672 length:822 start_codon:yes stop_codon:yes gene_type:complete